MCGRFTLTYRDHERLAQELGVPLDSLKGYRPRYNIAPTDEHWILRTKYEDRELLRARWGLVNFWAKDRKGAFKNINARAETVQKSPAFREAFKERRCVVPADGFFEWTGPKQARMPVWFHRPDGGLLYFAGLYESWKPEPEQWERTFTILTTKPNELMEPIHDRMPVVLEEGQIEEWMYARQNTDVLMGLLKPPSEEIMVATRVSARINSVKNDDPECLLPPEDSTSEKDVQGSLFGA